MHNQTSDFFKTININFDNMFLEHMIHHSSTKEDYTMSDGSSDYICFEVFFEDGLAQMVSVFIINSGFLYVLFYPTISLIVILLSVAFMLCCNVVIWNTVHSYVHGFDASKICSPPRVSNAIINEQNPIMRWFIQNHRDHHDHKKTNFNIVFPGADYLLGTSYRKKENIELKNI
jgi:hypothetical protein